jgi:Cys-tRNA synthase (O-phospho-L-seryl-tRNA:Cys-tRNA synthase)
MSFTTPYALTSDITDLVISRFVAGNNANLSKWRTECDDAVKGICETKGVPIETFEASGDAAHSKVKEYWRAHFCMIVCRDAIGINDVNSTTEETYRIKYDLYRDVVDKIHGQLTREVFQNTVSSSDPLGAGRVGGGTIWRG